jgi:hypothetical protein
VKLGPIRIIKAAWAFRRGKRKATKEIRKMGEAKILRPIKNDPEISKGKANVDTAELAGAGGASALTVVGLMYALRAFGVNIWPPEQDMEVAGAAVAAWAALTAAYKWFIKFKRDKSKLRYEEVPVTPEVSE